MDKREIKYRIIRAMIIIHLVISPFIYYNIASNYKWFMPLIINLSIIGTLISVITQTHDEAKNGW